MLNSKILIVSGVPIWVIFQNPVTIIDSKSEMGVMILSYIINIVYFENEHCSLIVDYTVCNYTNFSVSVNS